jgi:nucleoid-associated protein YgaU
MANEATSLLAADPTSEKASNLLQIAQLLGGLDSQGARSGPEEAASASNITEVEPFPGYRPGAKWKATHAWMRKAGIAFGALSIIALAWGLGAYSRQGAASILRGQVDRLQKDNETLKQRFSSMVLQPQVSPQSPHATYVLVRKGDHLWRLSHELYGSGAFYQKLAEANQLQPPYYIRPGQILKVPKNDEHDPQ